MNPGFLPRSGAIEIDARVALFAAAVAVATALVFGLVPALRIAGRSAAHALRSGARAVTSTRRAQRTRNGIVVAEVALSLVLVAQASWLLRSFMRLHQEPLGFEPERVLTLPLTPTGIESGAEWNARMEAVRTSLAATPGVELATFGLSMPLEYTGGSRCCWRGRAPFNGRAQPTPTTFHPVDADYFHVIGARLLAGQLWSRLEESSDPHPAVLTEPIALELFGGASAAIGQSFTASDATFRVVGVLEDYRHYGPDQEHGPAVFIPISQLSWVPGRVHMAVRVRTQSGEPPELLRSLRQAVWRAEPDLPVPLVRPMTDWAGRATAQSRFESALFAVFGAVALALVAAGLAGTLLYMLGLQRRDMGIRLALGATGRRLERAMMLRGLALAAIGSLASAVAAFGAGQLLESRLYGVDARDGGTLGAAVLLLMVVAALASWVPARRAAAIDPMDSLRAE